jgi:hypothetical protein
VRAVRGPGSAKGLCVRCYKAQSRGVSPTPERTRAPAGEGGRLAIRLNKATLEFIAEAARREGVTPVEYVRLAVMARLSRA